MNVKEPGLEEYRFHGFYRAKVTEVDIDDNDYGAVRVFVPDLMTDVDPDYDDSSMGLIAYPANNPIGGYNTEDSDSTTHYQSSMMVPKKNAWVWVFFEQGNPNRPFYFAAFHFKNSKVPPENRDVDEPHRVYTMIKTTDGRSVVVCDSDDEQRIEITGKKRQISGGPEGDNGSVYNIDGNNTTILLDERGGKEKILIRSHKGDYVHIDIDQQELQMYFKNDIKIKTDGDLHLQVKGDMHVAVDGSSYKSVNGNLNNDIGGETFFSQGTNFHVNSGGTNAIDGANTFTQTGVAGFAQASNPVDPEGERDT